MTIGGLHTFGQWGPHKANDIGLLGKLIDPVENEHSGQAILQADKIAVRRMRQGPPARQVRVGRSGELHDSVWLRMADEVNDIVNDIDEGISLVDVIVLCRIFCVSQVSRPGIC